MDKWVWYEGPYEDEYLLHHYAVKNYKNWILGIHSNFDGIVKPCDIKIQDIKYHLKGRNLICWCDLKQPCHADVLLKIANT
jgi:hypothetical protein